jgi:hypothetical protein
MFTVRSHALATFLIGVGRQPIDVEFHGALPVYLFPDTAYDDLPLYRAAKDLLDTMVERRRAVTAAGSVVSPLEHRPDVSPREIHRPGVSA